MIEINCKLSRGENLQLNLKSNVCRVHWGLSLNQRETYSEENRETINEQSTVDHHKMFRDFCVFY